MKSKRKTIFITLIIVFFVLVLGIFLYFYFTNPNRLNTTEKRFIAENSNVVQNVSVVNNVNLFGTNGSGIFYDFLDDFSKEYDLKMNPVTFNLGENKTGVSFTAGNTLSDNEFVFFQGHYALLSKNVEYIGDISHLANKRVGILSENTSYVKEFVASNAFSIVPYNTSEELLEAFDNQTDIDYIMVPLYLYLDAILTKDYYVVTHFSDIPYYYKISTGDNSILGNILEKYFNTWQKESFDTYYREQLFNLFVTSLGITLTDVDAMRAISYDYGFINNSPYEILTGGNYGGILAQ